MSDPKKGRGGWRGRGRPEQGVRPQGVRSWRKPLPREGGTRREAGPGRRRWLFGLGSSVSALVCLALLIWLLGIPGCLDTRMVVVAVPEYQTEALAPNSSAAGDLAALRSLKHVSLSEAEGTGSWVERIGRAGRGDVLIVYLNVFAGADPDGVHFLPPGAQPDKPGDVVTAEEFWKALPERPERKLVLLDVNRVPANWRFGRFRPVSPEEICAQAPAEDGLVILCSTATGERSWTWPGGGSVFGHFVARALAGVADGYGSAGKQNHRVSVLELSEYVIEETNNWVQRNRDPRGQHPTLMAHRSKRQQGERGMRNRAPRGQHPTLIPTSPEALPDRLNFEVAVAGDASGSSIEGNNLTDGRKKLRDELRKDLDALWQERQTLRRQQQQKPAPARLAPLRWRALTFELMRAEDWLDAPRPNASKPYERTAEIIDSADGLLDKLRNAQWLPAPTDDSFVDVNILQRLQKASQQSLAEAAGGIRLPEHHLKAMCRSPALPSEAAGDKQSIDRVLKTRRMGEEAAGRLFETSRWVEALLQQGDALRRESEDALFTGDANEAFSKSRYAEQRYQRLMNHAETVRSAQSILDRLLTDLPDLARWAAHRTLFPHEGREQDERDHRRRILSGFQERLSRRETLPRPGEEMLRRLRKEAERQGATVSATEAGILVLFEMARRLDRMLAPPPDGADVEKRVEDLRRQAGAAERLLRKVRTEFRRYAEQQLQKSNAPDAVQWRKIHDVLECPLLANDRRRALNDRRRALDDKLAGLSDSRQTSGETGNRSESSEIPSAREDLQKARWRSLWAIQVFSLGLPTPEESDPENLNAHLRTLWHRWRAAGPVDEAPPSQETTTRRRKAVASLGAEIRKAWRAKYVAVSSLLDSTGANLEGRRQQLVRAARLAATLHGYDALRDNGRLRPADRLRDFLLARLYLVQAERYIDDFWNSVDPERHPEPWYARAAGACLAVARERADGEPLLSEVDRLQRLLDDRRTARLGLNVDEPGSAGAISFGFEPSREIALRVSPRSGKLPPGTAAVWLELEPANVLEYRDGRQAVSVAGETRELTCTLRKDESSREEDCRPVEVRPRVWFRGHRWEEAVEAFRVDPCPQGIEFAYRPAPETGSVEVRGSDRRSILFVLDCSWSMRPRENAPPGEDSKFQKAYNTLKETLEELRDRHQQQNETTEAGLMAYGHRVQLLENQQQPKKNPNWRPAPNENIPDAPRDDYDVLAPPKALSENHLAEIMRQLKRLDYWGNTPLLGALNEACRVFQRQGRSGTIVAITDGVYNDYKDEKDNARLISDIQDKLSTLKDEGLSVEIHIVGYALGQLSQIEERKVKRLVNLARDSGGKFYSAPERKDLSRELEKAIHPRPYQVVAIGTGRSETQELDEPTVGLRPGRYVLRFPNRDPVRFEIAGGEHLVFELAESGLRHKKWQRDPRARAPARDSESAAPGEPTYLGCHSYRISEQAGTATFELSLFHEDGARIVRRPEEIAFAIRPGDDRKPRPLTWSLLPDRSIPTWTVTVGDWPPGAPATIRAYWRMKRGAPEATVDWANEDLDSEKGASAGLRNMRLRIEREAGNSNRIALLIRPEEPSSLPSRDLARLRVELGRQPELGEFRPADLPRTTEFLPDAGALRCEFAVGDPSLLRDPKNLVIALTSWRQRTQDARQLEAPLVVNRPDDEN